MFAAGELIWKQKEGYLPGVVRRGGRAVEAALRELLLVGESGYGMGGCRLGSDVVQWGSQASEGLLVSLV